MAFTTVGAGGRRSRAESWSNDVIEPRVGRRLPHRRRRRLDTLRSPPGAQQTSVRLDTGGWVSGLGLGLVGPLRAYGSAVSMGQPSV